jgi:hypothetical protein
VHLSSSNLAWCAEAASLDIENQQQKHACRQMITYQHLSFFWFLAPVQDDDISGWLHFSLWGSNFVISKTWWVSLLFLVLFLGWWSYSFRICLTYKVLVWPHQHSNEVASWWLSWDGHHFLCKFFLVHGSTKWDDFCLGPYRYFLESRISSQVRESWLTLLLLARFLCGLTLKGSLKQERNGCVVIELF